LLKKNIICVVTGSRAEYFLLKNLIKEIDHSTILKLQLIVTGMHLSQEFGYTFDEIEKDGFTVDKKIETILSSDTRVGTSKSVGLGIISFSEAFNELKPDLVVLLGDRFEIFAAASSALICQVPIAHLYGGEVTHGSIDDMLRNAITKMSNLHFVSTKTYKNRVIQMGEDPNNVHNVGALGVESISNTKLLSIKTLEKNIKFKFSRKNILVAYHPETSGSVDVKKDFQIILNVISSLENVSVVFTSSNADPGGRLINQMTENFILKYKNKNFINFSTLGHELFFSTVNIVDLVMGNSSSGIIEVPYLNTPTINIGNRQIGRVRCSSIIDCRCNQDEIETLLDKILNKKHYLASNLQKLPYGTGATTKNILKVLKTFSPQKHLSKTFNDIEY
jgi:GDP/UDP-N,N'-diacetylbacillosamine 2-epimerase (hydrolysing)